MRIAGHYSTLPSRMESEMFGIITTIDPTFGHWLQSGLHR